MNYLNIQFEIKEILKEAMQKKDYKKVEKIIDSFVNDKNLSPDMLNGILFKDVKNIIKTREDLEGLILSTKIIFEKKEDVLEFFELLLKYGFKEHALNSFEELLFNINDLELIEGFNSLLRK